ncbi:MAG TPA: phosphopantetheine-binding protein [Bryobacteraceae bacterium]|nr:phosphopantetheine-binding protein [Bryobacteraceae bacterium]
MDRTQFLALMDELLELDPGILKGNESLEGLENWNSLAVIGFMALANEHNGVIVSPRSIAKCKTVNDLIDLVGQ